MTRTPEQLAATHARCHTPENLAAADALRADIANSGLSLRKYARVILKRPARTVMRWAWLKSPIPKDVRDALPPATPDTMAAGSAARAQPIAPAVPELQDDVGHDTDDTTTTPRAARHSPRDGREESTGPHSTRTH